MANVNTFRELVASVLNAYGDFESNLAEATKLSSAIQSLYNTFSSELNKYKTTLEEAISSALLIEENKAELESKYNQTKAIIDKLEQISNELQSLDIESLIRSILNKDLNTQESFAKILESLILTPKYQEILSEVLKTSTEAKEKVTLYLERIVEVGVRIKSDIVGFKETIELKAQEAQEALAQNIQTITNIKEEAKVSFDESLKAEKLELENLFNAQEQKLEQKQVAFETIHKGIETTLDKINEAKDFIADKGLPFKVMVFQAFGFVNNAQSIAFLYENKMLNAKSYYNHKQSEAMNALIRTDLETIKTLKEDIALKHRGILFLSLKKRSCL